MLEPFVTVIIPTLNEEKHLAACLESLLNDPYPRDSLEIFIMDGGSSDKTVEIAESFAQRCYFIKVRDNPKRVQSAAFNTAMRLSEAEFLIRCDAHAEYPPNFITHAINAALENEAELVVFMALAKAQGCFQKAVAFVQTTPLGVGGSEYRLGKESQFVEHGWHGCFQRPAVLAVGGYDEMFSHNEDSELSFRLTKAGHKIWLDRRLSVGYYPRSTPAAVARQFWRYGKGRCQTVLKHKTQMKPRQLAPVALAAATPILLVLAAIGFWPALLPLGLYMAGVLAVSIAGAFKQKSGCVLLATVALPIVHFAWGAGFLRRWLLR